MSESGTPEATDEDLIAAWRNGGLRVVGCPVDHPEVPVVPQEARCPTCGSTDPKVRGRTDYGGTWGYWYCRDAWHVSPKESQ